MISDMQLHLLLEYWFPFSELTYTRQRGVWCDGIPVLEIETLNRVSFRINGVGFFPIHLTPFELEFHFINRRDFNPHKIIFRFGLRTSSGDLRFIGKHKHPFYVLAMRPKTNVDWAVAVELMDNHPAPH